MCFFSGRSSSSGLRVVMRGRDSQMERNQWRLGVDHAMEGVSPHIIGICHTGGLKNKFRPAKTWSGEDVQRESSHGA